MIGPGLTLLVNPASGRGRGVELSAEVEDILRSAGWRVEVVHSTSGDHLEEVAAACEPDRVLAVLSGDGGLARAAAGAARSGALLAPLPGGRGDDFVRTLGLARDPRAVASALTSARERAIDLGYAGDRPFLGVASVGFDSLANTVANGVRILRGQAVYAYGGVVAVTRYRPTVFHVDVDGSRVDVRGWTVAVGNSGRYGGGMRICPDALLDDGLLDVVILGGLRRREFPRVLQSVFAGTHVQHPEVQVLRGREVTVEAESADPLVVFADGDPVGPLPMSLSVRARALRLLA